MKRYGECNQCGGCCKFLRVTSVLSHILEQHSSLEEARLYYSYRGITITDVDSDEDVLQLEIKIPCDKLLPDNSCAVHDKPELKPIICHRYPRSPDDIEGCGFKWAP